MATLEQMQAAINKLVEGEDLPGLDFDTVVEKIVGEKYKKTLEEINDPVERKQQFNNMVDYYKTEARTEIQNKINDVKMCYKTAKAQIKSIQASIKTATASNAIPAVIVAGAGAAAPNPAYAIIENSSKVNQMLGALEAIGKMLYDLLKSALDIMFPIPDAIIDLINLIADIKNTIKAIPVP